MKTRPILMSRPMVRALPEKTQTRRTSELNQINEGPNIWRLRPSPDGEFDFGRSPIPGIAYVGSEVVKTIRCPFGQPGDLLWVRETCNMAVDKSAVMYMDHGGKLGPEAPVGSEHWAREWKTCSSIHMPRWASRWTLKLIDVRVQRVQEITGEDAEAEGTLRHISLYSRDHVYRDKRGPTAIKYFAELWDSHNANR